MPIRSTSLIVLLFALGGCAPSSEPQVSFGSDVRPILDRYCLECHQPGTAGYEASGYGVTTYAEVMKGTRYGPVVVPGDPFNSNLIILVEGRADPTIAMPHGDTKMLAAEIATLKTWIEQGARDN